ncbi:MAG TPA: SDR family oxidoreductase [Aldersonia sp.]
MAGNERVVAVTGGARGIGLEIARAFVDDGARVVVGDIDPQVVRVARAHSGMIGYAGLDVSDPASFAAFLDFVADHAGPVDILVNNAGVLSVGVIQDEPDDATRRMVEVNLLGVINGTKAALAWMLPRRAGQVINISSLSGEVAIPGGATYSATKHAVLGFSDAVRGELRGTGVEISCVLPTLVNTRMITGTGRTRGMRNAEPDEVAAAAVVLSHRPQPRVRVTRLAGAVSIASRFIPDAVWTPLARTAGLHDVFTTAVDHGARTDYEHTIQHLGQEKK